jgi:hypothetical protein
MPAPAGAPGEKSADADVVKALKAARKAAKRAEAAAARAEVDILTKSSDDTLVADYQAQIAALQAQIDELGAQPDPFRAPLRGVIGKAAGGQDTTAPVERRSLLAEAQEQKAAVEAAEYMAYLRMLAKSADPSTREQAEDRIERLLTKST